jgi:RNA polymerase sigma-70 factor (ECF subfamily)
MPVSDSEIIQRVRGGAKHHFALLVDRYKDRAMTLAVRMLKSREDAEEAIQDAFVRAYNAIEKFQGNAQFGTWLYRIVYNVCLTRLGKRKDEFDRVDYDDEREYEQATTFSPSIVMDYETDDMMRYIKKIIESLPAKYGTILTLFYVQDLTHEEICEVTHLPLGTVKVHLFRARALLQERLQNELQLETKAL